MAEISIKRRDMQAAAVAIRHNYCGLKPQAAFFHGADKEICRKSLGFQYENASFAPGIWEQELLGLAGSLINCY